MLVYSLRTAQENRNVDVICVCAPAKYHEKIKEWAFKYGITKMLILAESGKERYESVYNGIMALPAKARDTVIIMTAVCPFVSQKTMDKLYEQISFYYFQQQWEDGKQNAAKEKIICAAGTADIPVFSVKAGTSILSAGRAEGGSK